MCVEPSRDKEREHRPVHGTPPLDRRGFLRRTAGGAVLLAVGGLVPAGCAEDYPEADADGIEPLALSPKEYATARAVAEALLLDVPVDPGHVARELDREIHLIGEPVRTDMKTVLRLLEHLTFLGGDLRRLTALEPEARLDNLLGWGRSHFNLRRAAFHAVRTLIHFIAFADPATRDLTGYEGTWPERGVPIPAYPVDYGEIA